MNRKGFMRTLEAVVATLIILGFILFIFPKTERFEGYMPIELDRLSTSLISEIQNQDSFRKCVLAPKDYVQYEGKQILCSVIINDFIKQSLPPFSPWDYAFNVCNVDDFCYGFIPSKPDEVMNIDSFKIHLLNIDKSIFTKSLFVSVDDVMALPLERDARNLNSYSQFRIYFWEK